MLGLVHLKETHTVEYAQADGQFAGINDGVDKRICQMSLSTAGPIRYYLKFFNKNYRIEILRICYTYIIFKST